MDVKNIFFKILLPSFLCPSISFFVNDLNYYPLFFSLVIVLFNLKKIRFNKFLSIVYSIVMSYAIYSLSFLGYALFGNILDLILPSDLGVQNWSISDISFLLTLAILSPTLIYYLYKFIIQIIYTKRSLLLYLMSILSLIVLSLLPIKDDNKFINIYNLWQFIVIVFFQLALYINIEGKLKAK